MKTTFLKKFSLGLLAGVLILSHPATTQAAIITGFEPEEGFTPNGRNNTAGWTASNNNRARVSNGTTEPALEGSYSLRLEGHPTSPVGFSNWAWANPNDRLDTYSFSFTNPDATFVANQSLAWVYIRLEDQSGTGYLIQFHARYGDNASAPYRIQYHVDNGAGGVIATSVNISQSNMVFEEWNTISMAFNFETQSYKLMLNGVAVVNNIQLPDTWNTTAVVGTWLLSPTIGTTYYDSISAFRAIPEPSTGQILGLSILLLVGWKARHLV